MADIMWYSMWKIWRGYNADSLFFLITNVQKGANIQSVSYTHLDVYKRQYF